MESEELELRKMEFLNTLALNSYNQIMAPMTRRDSEVLLSLADSSIRRAKNR